MRWDIQLVHLDTVKPGDIIFITNDKNKITHGGLFIEWIGDNTFEFVNASSYYGEVVVNSWSIEGEKEYCGLSDSGD